MINTWNTWININKSICESITWSCLNTELIVYIKQRWGSAHTSCGVSRAHGASLNDQWWKGSNSDLNQSRYILLHVVTVGHLNLLDALTPSRGWIDCVQSAKACAGSSTVLRKQNWAYKAFKYAPLLACKDLLEDLKLSRLMTLCEFK